MFETTMLCRGGLENEVGVVTAGGFYLKAAVKDDVKKSLQCPVVLQRKP